MAKQVARLKQLLAEHTTDDITAMFRLLQEDRNGNQKEFSEAQMETIDRILPFRHMSFSEELVSNLVAELRATKSKMTRIGRTQLSRFILSLSREELSEILVEMIPHFVEHSGKFVDTLTADQKAATFDAMLPEVVENLIDKDRVAHMLLSLYSVSRISESLEATNEGI
jgi:hypothetical protein